MVEQKISIIIPVYNAAPFIRQCLESVLSQTYQNIEAILVDDGSVDGSGQICDQFQERDERIRVVHQSNQGVTAARNAALRLATGDWIGFVDADDWIEPAMYQTMLNTAEKCGADVVCCKIFDAQAASGACNCYGQDAALQLLLRGDLLNSLWNKLYRADLIRDIRIPPDIRYAEDLLINYFVFRNVQNIAALDAKFYHYVKHDGACTKVAVQERHFDSLKVSQVLLKENQDKCLLPYIIGRNMRANFAALTRIICGNAFWERYDPIRKDILMHKWDILLGRLQLPARYKAQLLLLWLFPAAYQYLLKRAKA